MRYIVFIILFIACKEAPKPKEKKDTVYDLRAQAYADSVVEAVRKKAYRSSAFDTAGLSQCPVKVISYKVVNKEYSTYRNVFLRWKNVSNKKIDAIKFRWYGVDAFGDPADMGALSDGIGGGYTDDPLKPGAGDSGEWDVLSRNLKKILIAYPVEVVFSDGSKWKLQ